MESLDIDVQVPAGTSPKSNYSSVKFGADALGQLIHIYEGWFPEHNFLEIFFKPMWDDETTSGENQIKEIQAVEEAEDFQPSEQYKLDEKVAAIKICILMTSCAFCIQSWKAKKNSIEAWQFAVDANRWLGILQGYISGTSKDKLNIPSPQAVQEAARRRGTLARAALYGSAQRWAQERWSSEKVAYAGKPSKAAPIYVRLIAKEFTTARGEALVVTVDTVKLWLRSQTPMAEYGSTEPSHDEC